MLRSVLRAVLRHRDPILAVVLALGMAAELAGWGPDDPGRSFPLVLLSTLPFVVRRSMPVLSFACIQVALSLLTEVEKGFDNDSGVFIVAFFLSLFSVGRYAAGREAVLGVLGVLAVIIRFALSEGGDLGDYGFVIAFAGAPWAAGITMRLRREREAVLHARNEQLRAEQEEATRRAVAAERSTIARELHDVVSHAISVTVLQSRGARALLGKDDAEVRKALDAIEQTNTAALGDMRRLLAVLRDTEPENLSGFDEHAPQPSLAHLDRLVEQVRSSGVDVDVEVSGGRPAVPPGVDLSAFRIIQEALTNVIKHAEGAAATVRLGYGANALEVEIRDDGTGRPDPEASSGGHGLVGIRERVAVVGGRVEAGPQADGGFAVRARLPYSLETS